MKTIGIIGAMEEEVRVLKEQMEIITAKKIIGIDFQMGKLCGKNVVLVRSGIGKVNAAICTQVLIDLYGVDYVLNTGVAGAIWPKLDVGDIVVSSDLVQHDFDATAFGDPLGAIPRLGVSFFKADEELVRMAREAGEAVLGASASDSSESSGCKLYVGRIATGDQFISTASAKQRIWENFTAYCTEMEGGAIAQTCYLNKIPFVVIRAVSDKADEEATVNFDEFVVDAAKNASGIITGMIGML